MDKQAKALQWNCRSASSKKSDIIYLINKYKPFIFALQETWLKPGAPFRYSGYTCLREDRIDGYGGVALLVKHHLPFSHFPISSHSNDFSIIAAIVNNICYVSIYIPHPSSSIFVELDSIISTLPKPFILLGDFNSQHSSWGSSTTNTYGVSLIELLDSHNLCFLNDGSVTRRTSPNEGSSVPDLSICTPSLASTISWSTLSSSYGSDHFPLLLSFPFHINFPFRHSPRLKYRLNDADWDTFKTRIEQKMTSLPNISHGSESVCAEALTKLFIEVADKTFPLKNGALGFIPSPPWWDQECSDAIKKRKQVELQYCENCTSENFDLVTDAFKATSLLFKKKKADSWKSFCLSISPNVCPSVVWRNIRRFRCAFTETSSGFLPASLNNQFLDRLAPSTVPERIIMPLMPLNPSGLNSPFSMYEIKGILSSLVDSAPGDDGIPYSFISHLGDHSLEYILIRIPLMQTHIVLLHYLRS